MLKLLHLLPILRVHLYVSAEIRILAKVAATVTVLLLPFQNRAAPHLALVAALSNCTGILSEISRCVCYSLPGVPAGGGV